MRSVFVGMGRVKAKISLAFAGKAKSPCPPARRHSLRAFSAARTCGSQARPFTLFQRGNSIGRLGNTWRDRSPQTKTPAGNPAGVCLWRDDSGAYFFAGTPSSVSSCGAGDTSCMIQRM
ncbi:hypothetical protein [Lysobacter gummosus]|uniref:hypothetical protein n=1 Tax=Lysobacter gummosus TaxID=262324 RepID=UPI003643D7BF